MYTKQKRRNNGRRLEKKSEIRKRLLGFKSITPTNLVCFVGLLLARVLCPHRRRLSHHWSLAEDGAIPRGSFGKYMSRNRFQEICRNLHFSNNDDPRAATDRAWKIRPVVVALQKTFRKGYTLPPVLSFDEGMLPSRSSYNKMRVYMKDKPHKWGTKLFLTCCAKTSYCLR